MERDPLCVVSKEEGEQSELADWGMTHEHELGMMGLNAFNAMRQHTVGPLQRHCPWTPFRPSHFTAFSLKLRFCIGSAKRLLSAI